MKKNLLSLLAIAALVACNHTDEPTPGPEPTTNPSVTTDDFTITVHAESLSAYSVTFDITPAKESAPYYFDVISKARLSEVDVDALKVEINTSAEKLAAFTGSTKEEVLASLLTVGEKLNITSDAGYKGEVTYCIYTFYWDDENGSEVTLCEFTTPAPKASSESLEISISEIDSYSMVVECTPSSGVERYYYYFAEKAKADQMFRELNDENAYLSYHAMNVGTLYSGKQRLEQKGLKPNVEYTVLVMAIDKLGNRFLTQQVQATPEASTSERVESELFELLVGEWEGTQSITDNYNPAATSTFNVTICSSVEDYDYDYRANNQLVALVDGWCDIAYYSVSDLIEYEIENPEEKFGPKWIFDIAEGDVVTMDGKAHHSAIGWMFVGDCFVLNAEAESAIVHTNDDFVVTVSDDKNTITISSPNTLPNAYPSLCYQFDGIGWMGYWFGCSEIVLTRK